MGLTFEKVAPFTYRIPRQGKMRVEAVFFASESILHQLEAEDYASLKQLQNVATLPGIVAPALAMPDIHWGYGFPIGGVAAMDAEAGVVSPGGVGFDINCGVRLLSSALSRSELEPVKEKLADILYARIPAGVGSERRDVRLGRKDLKRVLLEGAPYVIGLGFGEADEARFIESGVGCPAPTPSGSRHGPSNAARRSSGPWVRAIISSRSSTSIGSTIGRRPRRSASFPAR